MGSPTNHISAQVSALDLTDMERIVRGHGHGRSPALELVFDRLARKLRHSLPQILGQRVEVELGKLETRKFAEIQKELPIPSSLHIFKLPPLEGEAFVVLSTPLVYTVVEVLLGGDGGPGGGHNAKEFTAIEKRLVGRFALQVIESFSEAWSGLATIQARYVKDEENPLALMLAAPTDTVVLSSLLLELPGCSAELSIGIPQRMLSPIEDKLTYATDRPANKTGSRKIEAVLKETPVNVSVELGCGKISGHDASTLKRGDTLMLETPASAPAIIKVEGIPKYSGKLGTFRGNHSVKILGLLKK